MRYTTVWIKQWVSDLDEAVQECPDIDRVVNEYAAQGWTLHSLVPGTNPQTNKGVFATFLTP